MACDRCVGAYGEHRGQRGDLVRITAICQRRQQHHRKARCGEHRGSHDAQVQSGYDQQMSHPGAGERLPERLADFTLIADHQRAHFGVFRIGEIAIEELADVSPYRFDSAGEEQRTMPDDLKRRRAERLLGRGHRRVDSVARHQCDVIELAGIAVVAREMNSRGQLDFIAELENSATDHRDPQVAAGRRQSTALLGGPLDGDVDAVAVGLVLGLAIHASFDRDARALRHRGDTVGGTLRREQIRNGGGRGARDCNVCDRHAEHGTSGQKCAERHRGERRTRMAAESRGGSCRARRRLRPRLRPRRLARAVRPG